MTYLTNFEYGISPAAFLILFAYHVHLYRRLQRDPLSIAMGLASRTRGLWVREMMEQGKDIVAVQSLRNWITSAVFLASSAIVIGLGIFNLAITADRQGSYR